MKVDSSEKNTSSQSSAVHSMYLRQKLIRSLMFFFVNNGFLAGLHDLRPLSNKRLLIVCMLITEGSCDWIFADDDFGDRLANSIIALSVRADVTFGLPLRLRDL